METVTHQRNNLVDIIRRYIREAPVDVYSMARDLGISVKEKELPDEVSGSIEKIDENYLITVNSLHATSRKRFTIAHEIGHFFLHEDLLSLGKIQDNKLYRSCKDCITPHPNQYQETEANKFAASMLMPTPLINNLKEQGFSTPKSLAIELDVSEQAMAIRLAAG